MRKENLNKTIELTKKDIIRLLSEIATTVTYREDAEHVWRVEAAQLPDKVKLKIHG